MKLINQESKRPAVVDNKYTVELTGEELIRMSILSYRNEAAKGHASGIDCKTPRLAPQINKILGLSYDDVVDLFDNHFKDGRYVG